MSKRGNGRGALLFFTRAPNRVVSLVPSMTESVIDLHAGAHLIGVTDYCPKPPKTDREVTRIGGTRTFDPGAVIDLKPDLIMANQEENPKPAVEELEQAGLRVWVTFPRTVEQAMSTLWTLVDLFRVHDLATERLRTLELTLEWTTRASRNQQPVRVFCPIWRSEPDAGQDWWMTFNRDTYAHDVLARCGGVNIFSDRLRRYPLEADLGLAPPEPPEERDVRYPRVTSAEVCALDPEVILLPSEPFPFADDDVAHMRRLLHTTRAVATDRIYRIDGRMVTWHGTRLAHALTDLPSYLQAHESSPS
jgi:ABC-type Fe3+-hydroxamate transport system substrate-binding protein